MKNDNSKTPILNIENISETSDQRRKFLKQVVISGTGAVTFVKSASAASSEGALPSIISLLLEDEAAFDPSTSTFNPPEQFESNQDIDIPAGAKFMQVEASGAGGGGSASTAAFENSLFTAGVNGGAGGRATATYDIEQFGNAQLVARVGTGGGASVGNAGGASSSGGIGGNRQIVNGVSVATTDSFGGQGGNGGGGLLDGATGAGSLGGNGGSSDDGGSGGGGGAGLTFCAESNEDCSGAGGGGGAGAAGGGGGGGAGGTNFIDTDIFQPLAGFNDDVGAGGAGGQGGLSGESAETSAADRAAEPGAPAQLVVTFFAKNPNA
jgi:hypothetical protein